MKFNQIFVVIGVVSVLGSSAFGGEIAKKAIQKSFMDGNKDSVAGMNTACGTKITLTIPMDKYDQKVWGNDNEGGGGSAPSCANVCDGVRHLCEKSSDFKNVVASKVKSIACQPTNDKTYSLKLVGTKLEYKAADPGASSVPSDDTVTTYLTGELDK